MPAAQKKGPRPMNQRGPRRDGIIPHRARQQRQHDGDGQERRSRGGGGKAGGGLQEIGKQKPEAAEGRIKQERCGVGGGKIHVAKKPEINQRICRVALPPDEGNKAQGSHREGCDGDGGPIICRALDEAEGDAAEKQEGKNRTGPVDADAAAHGRFLQRRPCQHDGKHGERHIEEEDGAPGKHIDEIAADQGPERQHDRGGRGPVAHGAAAQVASAIAR